MAGIITIEVDFDDAPGSPLIGIWHKGMSNGAMIMAAAFLLDQVAKDGPLDYGTEINAIVKTAKTMRFALEKSHAKEN